MSADWQQLSVKQLYLCRSLLYFLSLSCPCARLPKSPPLDEDYRAAVWMRALRWHFTGTAWLYRSWVGVSCCEAAVKGFFSSSSSSAVSRRRFDSRPPSSRLCSPSSQLCPRQSLARRFQANKCLTDTNTGLFVHSETRLWQLHLSWSRKTVKEHLDHE